MMTSDYQAFAMRTSPDGHDRVLNGCLGLIGESGEVVDVVKKWRFQSGDEAPFPKDRLIDECGDILWYCAELCKGVKTDLGWVISEAHRRRHDEQCMVEGDDPACWAYILSRRCGKCYHRCFVCPHEKDNILRDVGEIVMTAELMLRKFAGATLEDAMIENVEKLRRRYPNGFDPERSLHRAE